MNKLRLIKIYELRGNTHPIEQYIIDLLDGIEKIYFVDYIGYWEDSEFYFSCYLEKKYVYLSSYLETKFKDKFVSSIYETRVIMKYLLEKHLKLKINEVR